MSISALKDQPAAGQAYQGVITPTTLPHLFHKLWGMRATGVLKLTRDEITRTVDFESGHVLFASSNDRDDRFNQVLLKAGVISLKDLMRVLEVALATKDRLGEVMLRWNLITPQEVEKHVKMQVRDIIYDLFDWTKGTFVFEECGVQADPYALGVTADVMLVEGMRRISSWARVYNEVGGLNAEYLATNDMPTVVAGLPLQAEEREILEMCMTPVALGEICETSTLLDYQVCRVVWMFLILGALMKS